MVFFANTEVTIYEEIRDTVNKDGYGKPTKSLQLVGTVKGDVQPTGSQENMKEFGASTSTGLKIYFPINTNITKKSKVTVEGYEGIWQVIGDPQIRRTLIPHIKVIIMHEEKEFQIP